MSLGFVKVMTVYTFLWDFPQVHQPDTITSLYLYGEDGAVDPDYVYPSLGVSIKKDVEEEEVPSSVTATDSLSPVDNGPSSPVITDE